MRNMTALAGIALLAVLAAPAAQAAIEVNQPFDFHVVVFVPCANGGAGELVELTGRLHVLLTFTLNKNHVSGVIHTQAQGLSGVGLETGDRYHATGMMPQESFTGSLKNGVFTDSFVNNFKIIGQGRGNNFLVQDTFHLTINANGQATSLHDGFRTDCK